MLDIGDTGQLSQARRREEEGEKGRAKKDK